jgi:hypothetical protein
MVASFSRRGFPGACAALSASAPASGFGTPLAVEAPALDARELRVGGDPRLAEAALVLTPRGAATGEQFPLLVLLHGLAETRSEAQALRAWSERYGLVAADARLRHPPVTCENPGRYLPHARAARIDAELSRLAYRGFVLVCPVTPNVYKAPSQSAALDRYAEWIDGVLLPAVRASAPATTDPAGTAIDGCSLGGYVALEVFLRKPASFGIVGGVQTAIGEASAVLHADRIHAAVEHVGPRGIHIESSLWDPSMKAHAAMSRRLGELGVAHDFDVLPGGHDQTFLREVGTLEMLFWHDRKAQERAGRPWKA